MYRHLERCRLERGVSAHGGVRLIGFAVRAAFTARRPRSCPPSAARLRFQGQLKKKLDRGLAPVNINQKMLL